MGRPGPARGPKRAGPENPGPRALRAETGRNGPNDFLFKIPLCAGRWVVTMELCIVVLVTCNVLCIEQMYKQMRLKHFVLVIYGRATTKIFTHAVNG